MDITLLKSKIHRAVVTDANLNYQGSISIDPTLYERAGMRPYEKVDVLNCNNGARFSTYVIKGGPQEICLNGAAARHAQPGDLVIIVSYAQMSEVEADQFQPKLVFVNDKNQITESQGEFDPDSREKSR